MRKNRFVYFSTLILLAILIFIHETPMTYMALYSVLILPVFSFLFTILSRNSFTISENLEKDSIVKGEEATYFFTVKNNSFLPCTNVGIHFESESPAIDVAFTDKIFSVMPHKSYQAKFELTAKYSGKYELGVKSVILYDFLGLFSFKQPHKNKINIKIRPNVLSINPLPLAKSDQGDDMSRNNNQEDDYSNISDLRKYQPTDGYKKIHWKASARKNELMSKNFSSNVQDSTVILLDNTSIKTPLKPSLIEIEKKLKKEDILLETCAALLSYSHKNMFLTELGCMGTKIPIKGDFNYLYNTLEKIKFSDDNFDNYVYDFHQNLLESTNIIIISQKISDRLVTTVSEMSLSGNNVIIIYFETSDTKVAMSLSEYNKVNCFNFNEIKK